MISGRVDLGTIVRVELHGRRVGGWVTALLDAPHAGLELDELKPIAKVTGCGPGGDVIDLAEWASVRWAARRIRPFLVSASPKRAVTSLPPPRRTAVSPGPSSPATTALLRSGGGVLRLPPRADPLPPLLSCLAQGPTLVVVPSHAEATMIAARLRRAGASVALVPDDWAAAAAGVDVVVGSRTAAWMPCADLAAAIVLDEHDEALQEERAPTWHARDVVAERCRRLGVPAIFVSPTPTIVAIEELAGERGVVHPPAARERRGWPIVTVVDRSDEEPWKRSLITSPLIERLRDRGRRVVCVSNTTGRARVLACRSCRALIRCERCEAAVGLDDERQLVCRRCDTVRPPVCQACGASRFANLRPGVTRLREELEAAAGRPVASITGVSESVAESEVYVGTEAVLHRVGSADVVAFLEFDSEMLAPRFRAAEQALALIVRAGRVAPEVMVQTFDPGHEVLRAARHANPSIVAAGEGERRRMLGLPPYGALAVVSGSGSDEFVAHLDRSVVTVGGNGSGRFLVRAETWAMLGVELNRVERPAGARIRVEVDPARI